MNRRYLSQPTRIVPLISSMYTALLERLSNKKARNARILEIVMLVSFAVALVVVCLPLGWMLLGH